MKSTQRPEYRDALQGDTDRLQLYNGLQWLALIFMVFRHISMVLQSYAMAETLSHS